MTQLTHISQMVDIAKYRLCLIGVTPVPSYHDGMVVEFSKRMTCTWNIFGMNSWNGNLIIHETGGVSWLNVSVSQATCQTLTVVQWWRWLFILRTVGLMVKLYISFWWGAEVVLDSHVTAPEANILGTWKSWCTNWLYFFLTCFFGGKSHTKKFAAVKQTWSSTNSPITLWATPKKIPFPLFAPGSSDAMWNFSLSQHVTRAHCPLVSRLDKVICRV